jgi:anaerobic ribonucleoside-triphosphate reductase activating protein
MPTLRIHAWEPASRANGPGLRSVVWVQGCTLGCPGCFNPGTHDPAGGAPRDTADLAAELLARGSAIEGVSLSGGEPFQQPEGMLDLLTRLDGSGLSRLAFSGYTLTELERQPLGPAILAHLDALVAGRYVAERHVGRALIGSDNQRIHLLTRRHTLAEFARIPPAEFILHADGTLTRTGIGPVSSGSDRRGFGPDARR